MPRSQDRTPHRGRSAAGLAVLLVLPALSVTALPLPFGPCIAAIDEVAVTPSIWVDAGRVVRIRARVVNTAGFGQDPDPSNPLAPRVRVHIEARYADGSLAVSSTSVDLVPPANFTRSFTVRSDAPAGLGRIIVELLAPSSAGSIPCMIPLDSTPTPHCVNARARTCNWGFVVGDKPDPVVTSFTMWRHSVSDIPGVDIQAHNESFGNRDRFTRYQSYLDLGTHPSFCFEQDIVTGYYSGAHFRLSIRNNGSADYSAPDGSGIFSLPLRVRILDNGVSVDTNTVPVNLRAGQSGEFLMDTIVYNIRNKTGVRNITVIVDPLNQVPETDEANNEFTNARDVPDDPTYLNIRAPDLAPVLRHVEYNPADQRIEGDWTVFNNGKSRAGRSQPVGQPESSICHSADGRDFNSTVYLDRIAPDAVISTERLSLDPNVTAGLSFTTGQVGAGMHRIFVVADSDRRINDLDVTNNVDEVDVLVGE